jgi:hypothetical protein
VSTIPFEATSPDSPAVKEPMEENGTPLDVRAKELEIRGHEVDLPLALARLGMRGTVMSIIAGAVVLMTLAIASIFSTTITGVHLCVMVGIVSISVALYGGFVFERAVRVALGQQRAERAETKLR